jgi:selenocysteine-specific elongation factor
VALTKRDLVDDERLDVVEEEVRERLAGTALAAAPIVPLSAQEGSGIDEVLVALDAMVAAAARPAAARTRLFVDRVFAIKGAGTVVTGTLTGGCLRVGDEVEIAGVGRARIRSLQTHRTEEAIACPVSRVAANLVGVERDRLARGMVLTAPRAWRPTSVFDGSFRPIRGLSHAISARGAYKLYVGAAEIDVRLRVLDGSGIGLGEEGFVRLRTSEPVTLDVGDRYVLRESGRRETVGGGVVLDPAPPLRGAGAVERLRARADASRDDLPTLLVRERGVVRVEDARLLTGSDATPRRAGDWFVRDDVADAVDGELAEALAAFHRDEPLAEGMPVRAAREAIVRGLRTAGIRSSAALADDLLGSAVERGVVARTTSSIRLPSHRAAAVSGSPEGERLLAAIGGARATSPPTIPELVAGGVPRTAIDAAIADGTVVRVAPDLVFTTETIDRARRVVREAGAVGVTVSTFRQALGTSRKYALPILGWFDVRGFTRREGDVRIARETPER